MIDFLFQRLSGRGKTYHILVAQGKANTGSPISSHLTARTLIILDVDAARQKMAWEVLQNLKNHPTTTAYSRCDLFCAGMAYDLAGIARRGWRISRKPPPHKAAIPRYAGTLASISRVPLGGAVTLIACPSKTTHRMGYYW